MRYFASKFNVLKKKKYIIRMLVGLILLYTLILLGTFVFQKYIIFQPKKLDNAFQFAFDQPFEELFLQTILIAGGITLQILRREGMIFLF